jgi:hypothetical protein
MTFCGAVSIGISSAESVEMATDVEETASRSLSRC